MRRILLASAGVLALAACSPADTTADTDVTETEPAVEAANVEVANEIGRAHV